MSQWRGKARDRLDSGDELAAQSDHLRAWHIAGLSEIELICCLTSHAANSGAAVSASPLHPESPMEPPQGQHFRYADRRHAGAVLAASLSRFAHRQDVVVLALPRGGVPIGYEIAHALGAPLDVWVVRKLGLPAHPELAMGAIASGGVRVLNDEVLTWYPTSGREIDEVTRLESAELQRREQAYRGLRPPTPLQGRVVILVDDGLATGATMKAAIMSVAQHRPARVVVAVPVGARDTCASLASLAEVVCPFMPEPLQAVGLWYDDFSQTSDDEVRDLLSAHRAMQSDDRATHDHE